MTNKPNDVRVSRELLGHAIDYMEGSASSQVRVWRKQLIDRLAQPADQQGEPVAWQWRRKTERAGSLWTLWTDCSEVDYEACIASPQPSVRGIIREVRRLYAQPATAKVDERAEFESWFLANVESDEGLTLERSAARPDQYELDETAQIYRGWQARAKLNGGQS